MEEPRRRNIALVLVVVKEFWWYSCCSIEREREKEREREREENETKHMLELQRKNFHLTTALSHFHILARRHLVRGAGSRLSRECTHLVVVVVGVVVAIAGCVDRHTPSCAPCPPQPLLHLSFPALVDYSTTDGRFIPLLE